MSRMPCFPLVTSLILVGLMGAQLAGAERPAAPRLLPDTTVVMINVPSAPQLSERFMNTQLGRISQDEQLKPLVGHLYGSLSAAVDEVQERVGLSLTEMLALPQGELCFAVVAPKDAQPAIVVIIDAKRQIANARKLIEKGAAALEESGATKTEEEIGGVRLTTYERQGRQRRATFFEKENTIVAGTDAEVLKRLLAQWNGEKTETLADNFNYNAIMNRCRSEKETAPQVLWYVDPIGLMRSMAVNNTGLNIALAMLPSLGLDGLLGVGGTVAFDAGHFDSLAHTHILLETPRSGVLKMIALEPVDMTPERWVPTDVASYMTVKWNVGSTFSTLASLYDSFRGEGALSKAMSARILGPTGIDLEKEIIPHLDGRITMITRYGRPVTESSQEQMLALKLKDAAPLEKALETLSAKYGDRLKPKEYAGKKYYYVEMPPPRRPDAPPMPQPGFAVIDGYLMMTDRVALLEKITVTLAEGKSLADELDFKLVTSRIKRQAADTAPAMIAFNRPREAMRFFYELAHTERIRQGLKRGSERNRFFRSLDAALEENPLPPFAVIEQYLAPSGAFVVDDDTGLHYTAFSLRRKAE